MAKEKELKAPKCYLVCAADGVPIGKSIHAYTERQAASLANKKGFPLVDPLYLRENKLCDPLSGKRCIHLADGAEIKYPHVIAIASAIITRLKAKRKPRIPTPKPKPIKQLSLFPK